MFRKINSFHYIFFIFLLSCSEDQVNPKPTPIELSPPELEDHFLLVNDAGNNRVFLMDTSNEIQFEWDLISGIGNDCYLLDNGQLLAILQAENPFIDFGGYGGILQLVNPNHSVSWEYIISDENRIAHHDVEMLPNGNILTIVWEKKSIEEAKAAGFQENYAIYPESLLEINPSNNEVVWEWHSWDHLIQDYDNTKSNFGNIAANPSKIDINYSLVPNGDIMHANGLDYDPENDLIYLSVNFFSEVWVIDHSTTTEIAKTDSGGNYNKGGDLVYRFGNPEAYQNDIGKRLFYNNHYPNIITENGQKRMLLFMNGYNVQQSTIFEFDLERSLEIIPEADNEPEILWEFTHSDLFSSKVSGAEILPNGNILITIGTFGIWEVNREGEILWQYEGDGFYWRTYPYLKTSDAIKNLNID